ncbi:MAE_28990/MAE_18760 family HEPN-like nuclease [Endozoicomonas sp. Mp262]|uniref:MAE_28990/MAE_18760 family HEPN-like nuclease n=1 Tax=Endozoicomonas sp. Mp262 TaxID=2919499 RepID=UPI0021D8586F
MKIKSKNQFLDHIQKERAWRRKELTNVKSLIHGARASHSHTLIRSGILLLYSHWEGYVKKVCEAFFYYLNFKAIKYSELSNNLRALGIISEFDNNFPYKKFSSYLKSVNFVLTDCKNKRFKLDVEKNIDTQSNLNTEVLNELLDKVGVDSTYFSNHKFYIDNRLLKCRNAIAHGERTDNNQDLSLTNEEFYDLYAKVNSLMDHFENIVVNHLERESYKTPRLILQPGNTCLPEL